jgi:hypothetical protein
MAGTSPAMTVKKNLKSSRIRKPRSSPTRSFWIPAYAGMNGENYAATLA